MKEREIERERERVRRVKRRQQEHLLLWFAKVSFALSLTEPRGIQYIVFSLYIFFSFLKGPSYTYIHALKKLSN